MVSAGGTRTCVHLHVSRPLYHCATDGQYGRAIVKSTYIHRGDVTRRPVDLLEKEPLKGNCEVHLHTPLRCSAAKEAELDSAAAAAAQQKAPFAAVWREAGAYII